jgi:hypothetical protein
MNDAGKWQEENARYLAAALQWVRFRLQRQATRESSHIQPAPVSVESGIPQDEPSLFQRLFGQSGDKPAPSMAAAPVALLLPASDQSLEEQIVEAAKAVDQAAAVEPAPALHILAERFGLSRFERDLLLLCSAIELDTSIASLCNLAQGSINRPYPTFALALALFDQPAWEALSPERPLRYWRLVEINQPGAQPLTTSALRADERIVNYLKGLNYVDDRLTPFLVTLSPFSSGRPLPESQQNAATTIIRRLQLRKDAAQLPVIQLPGSDSASKQLIAWHAATNLGLHLYRLPAEWLPTNATELDTLARFINRESALLPVAFYVDSGEVDKPTGGDTPDTSRSSLLQRFLTRINCLVFLDTRDVRTFSTAQTITVDVAKPTRAEQQAAWEQALGDAAADSTAQLAGQFNLGLSEIERIAKAAAVADPTNGDERTLHERLWDECLASTRPRLDELAQRLDAKATWRDLVLPPQEIGLLRQIAAQVSQRAKVYEEWGFSKKMNRGLGISALFAGDSGTGKTMAAEVIANDLRLNLYRIDLSAVVSKYIGETEKNLRRLFDAAEDGGAILFFDEADALFGKRSEVKDSHDRYANIEINYLLQRLEAYRGLAILATNMKNALDAAFTRRLRFIVNFPFPGLAERREIWRDVFPPETLTSGVDIDRLSRLNLTGGNIHNVALNAAFLAAKANRPVTMPLIFDAARAEFGKLERLVSEADLYWPESPKNEEEAA